MTERPHDRPLNEEEASRHVRDLPLVAADASFKERLRAAFVTDSIDEHLVRDRTSPPSIGDEDDHEASRGGRRLLTSVAWAIAACVALVAVGLVWNRGPAPRVLELTGSGQIVIDGESIPVTDVAAVEARLRPGASVWVPSTARLVVRMPGIGVYELVPGTRVTLPGVPGRWWRRTVVGSVLVGEFRFKSEPGFSGSQLTLHTPEGLVEITGTLLSIQCDDSGTCVCVLEGHVRVGVDRDDLELIEPGSRKVMLRNGEVKIVPVKPMHRDGVLEFADRIGAVTEEE